MSEKDKEAIEKIANAIVSKSFLTCQELPYKDMRSSSDNLMCTANVPNCRACMIARIVYYTIMTSCEEVNDNGRTDNQDDVC